LFSYTVNIKRYIERKYISMKKTILSYVIAIVAGAIAFFAAINIRSCVLLAYQVIRANQMQYGGALLNIMLVIVLMAAWVVYIFFTQYYFEKKIGVKTGYISALLKIILPVAIVFAATQIFLSVIS